MLIIKINWDWDLCSSYAYAKLILKYDFKDSYNGILYLNMFFLIIINESFVHNWNHCISVRKRT